MKTRRLKIGQLLGSIFTVLVAVSVLLAYVLFAPQVNERLDLHKGAVLTFLQKDAIDGVHEDELTSIVRYRVNEQGELGEIMYGEPHSHPAIQADKELHIDLWERFTKLTPVLDLNLIHVYELATDGPDGTVAQVLQSTEEIDAWIFAIDPLDVFDSSGNVLKEEFALTLAHEFAHLLTVSEGQIEYSEEVFDTYWQSAYEKAMEQARSECEQYFLHEGCSTSASYLNLFVESFWSQDMLAQFERVSQIEDVQLQDEALLAFYDQYYWEFLNDYAATHPEEDFAESFAQFLLIDVDAGDSVYLQKIRFFEQFPELVEMRMAVREAYANF